MLPVTSSFIVPFGRQRNSCGFRSPFQWTALPSLHQRHGEPAWDPCDEDKTEEDAVFPMENLWRTIIDHDPFPLKKEIRKRQRELKSQGRRKRLCSLSWEMIDRASKIPKLAAALEPFVQHSMGLSAVSASLFPVDKDSNIWQQKIDFPGFKLSEVKVKLINDYVVIKAVRMKDIDTGKEISSLRKCVTLPQNIDMDKIKCKMSPQGHNLIIEAPYIERQSTDCKQISHDDIGVQKLIAHVLPELKQQRTLNSTPLSKEEMNNERSEKDKSECEEKTNLCDGQERNQKDEDKESTKTKQDIDETSTVEIDNCQTQDSVIEFSLTGNSEEADSFVPLSKFVTKSTGSSHDSCDVQGNNCENETADMDIAGEFPKDVPVEDRLEKDYQETSSANVNDSEASKTDSTSSQSQVLSQDSMEKVCNSKTKVLFRLEMPSYKPESITVNFDEGKRHLQISARKETGSEQDGDKAETVNKTVHVPDDVDVNLLQCQYRDGSLSVIAPQKTSSALRPILVDI